MRRREFIAGLGSTVAWPLVARAQQPAMPVVGFLFSSTSKEIGPYIARLTAGLAEIGYVEGRNVAFEYRWADDDVDRLPSLVDELVRRKVAVIVATPGVAALAAKAATTTIPIVFQTGGDPVKLGLVASFDRPGGNLTGISQLSGALVAKRLELLHKLVPKASVIGVFADPQGVTIQEQLTSLRGAANTLGLRLVILNLSGSDIESVFANLARQRADALFVTATAFLSSHYDQLSALAARYKMPAIYEDRSSAMVGGLISYGVDFLSISRQLGIYAGKILMGARPSDLPVQLPTKFELVINLKTAKALGLTIPPNLLAIADEVIE
jgi:putative tryptophan/tyrosine transport system substrate-binding protein